MVCRVWFNARFVDWNWWWPKIFGDHAAEIVDKSGVTGVVGVEVCWVAIGVVVEVKTLDLLLQALADFGVGVFGPSMLVVVLQGVIVVGGFVDWY